MAERRQKIRGTTLELDQVIGAQGLLAVDYEQSNLRLYDGVTMGGFKLLNSQQIADLYTLPQRLKPEGVSIAGANRSANEANVNGYYSVDALVTDLPIAAAGTIHTVTSPNGQVTQVFSPDASTSQYSRVRTSAAAWGPWRKMVSTYDLSDPAGGLSAYNALRLGGELPAYYTAINARLGYTAANKAGDVFGGNVGVTGTLDATGAIASGGTITATGSVRAGGANAASLATNGDVYGSAWGVSASLFNWLTVNKVSKAGDTISGVLTMNGRIAFTRTDVAGSVVRNIYSDGNSFGFLVSGGGWAFRSSDNGDFVATGRVYSNSGASYLDNNGNLTGSAWSAWGSTSAYDAIAARIETRAQAWRNDAIANIMPTIAAQGASGVGTYALLLYNGPTAGPGTQVGGGSLWYASAAGSQGQSVGFGNWRLMGYSVQAADGRNVSLWLRYS